MRRLSADDPAILAVKVARDHEVLLERHSGDVARCTNMLTVIYGLTTGVEDESVTPVQAVTRVKELVVPRELELLPDELGDVVAGVASALRGLSVTIWNESSSAEAAQAVLRHALLLPMPESTRHRLLEDQRALEQAVKDRAQHLENERNDLRKLSELLVTMMTSIAQNRGDKVNWPYVGARLSELFSADVVEWLTEMRPVAPVQVQQVVISLAGPMAGLVRFYPEGYATIVRQLRPLTSSDSTLARLLEVQNVQARADGDPAIRRATRGPAVWEQSWFWWTIIIGFFMLLGQFA